MQYQQREADESGEQIMARMSFSYRFHDCLLRMGHFSLRSGQTALP
ncbi:hypothetical protein NK553_15325 [Pseudomonas sp. ZM23]|uniref:Uncharacterized protein n=1 Tax=Pseudomonas triclosanedens TaxID=2961893 RepID=A0ABY6ZY41_9PSED|nr:hypothetical protein [Pseudomonas triclosanedens]MCP8465321.1 hypothetical protein [Pseudomonas triclosanedens]MCP8470739.1 hypothetical protein [Pseudomonas triclosanedens]MCP8476620.1 hypothetical protein [Pseudomonas triclosanedens]WAI48925.1 hypothetical protein OU419_24770 [Pseudomonas triclosanedens]